MVDGEEPVEAVSAGCMPSLLCVRGREAAEGYLVAVEVGCLELEGTLVPESTALEMAEDRVRPLPLCTPDALGPNCT